MNNHLPAVPFEPAYAQIDLKNATIRIKDGSGGTTGEPNMIEIKIGEGNLTYTERKEIEYTLDRGRLDEVREGDEVPMEVRFDFVWDYIKGSSTTGTDAVPTVEDALKKRGAAAAWISTDDDSCRPYAVDIEIDYEPNCPGQDKETIVLPDFRYEQLEHDLRNGTVSCDGRCNVKEAAVTRAPMASPTE